MLIRSACGLIATSLGGRPRMHFFSRLLYVMGFTRGIVNVRWTSRSSTVGIGVSADSDGEQPSKTANAA